MLNLPKSVLWLGGVESAQYTLKKRIVVFPLKTLKCSRSLSGRILPGWYVNTRQKIALPGRHPRKETSHHVSQHVAESLWSAGSRPRKIKTKLDLALFGREYQYIILCVFSKTHSPPPSHHSRITSFIMQLHPKSFMFPKIVVPPNHLS